MTANGSSKENCVYFRTTGNDEIKNIPPGIQTALNKGRVEAADRTSICAARYKGISILGWEGLYVGVMALTTQGPIAVLSKNNCSICKFLFLIYNRHNVRN